jgi:hypothetical protein
LLCRRKVLIEKFYPCEKRLGARASGNFEPRSHQGDYMEATKDNPESGFFSTVKHIEHKDSIPLDLGPAKKNVIATFKVRVAWGRKTSYVHAIKVFERKGHLAFHCSRLCGQAGTYNAEPCAALRLAEKAIAPIIKSPETAVADLRAFVANGGDTQALLREVN